MKKNLNECFLYKGSYVRMFKVMKLTMLFIFLGIFHVAANNSYSQNARISLDLKDAQLKEVLTEIQKQTEFSFFYSPEDLDNLKEIDLKVRDAKLDEVLDECFKGTGLEYEIKHKAIVLKKSTKPESEIRKETDKPKSQDQEKTVNGKVVDESQMPMPGVSIIVKGTTIGVISDLEGNFTLEVPEDAETLQFSFVGYKTQEIPVDASTFMTINMEEDIAGIDEVIVIGYGTQKKSDITGSVASIGSDKLEMTPNVNIAQAIQGSIPGVMIQTAKAGASPSEAIMIRGRNSILASNNPLIVVDGIPYGGNISDINPSDVASIEILRDASAAAIYGSRGSNGVILVTTKEGAVGKTSISYEGKYSIQRFTNLPDMLSGPEFYDFKMIRDASQITDSEIAVYLAGDWVDWYDLGVRNGASQEHNLSISGGTENVKYYIGAGYLDIKGLMVNDDFQRISTRVNIETKVTKWLKLGTRSQFTLDDASGESPDSWVFRGNPLTTPYDKDGNLTVFHWPEKLDGNPLQETLFENKDKSYQIVSNIYAEIDFPFVKGLNYRLNTGLRYKTNDEANYAGRNTERGYVRRGESETRIGLRNNLVVENIFSYTRDFGDHTIFATALYSMEKNLSTTNTLSAKGFPNDFLVWNGSAQAELIEPSYGYNKSYLISQMARLNYSYDSRYLITLTARRDGFSGFGSNTKWGVFPSVALGWNIANESFFTLKDIFNEVKLRGSLGLNGNQAVGAYETISRLGTNNNVSGTTSLPGYSPTKLGQDELGWESSRVINAGLDFGLLGGRFSASIDYYLTNTSDLLLNRTISSVHGISEITQNIGETKNNGLEFSLNSRNIISKDFKWITEANLSFNKNEIVSLYGMLDDEGNEVDDINNRWFIGQPIRVNYGYVVDGIWQLDETEGIEAWGTEAGFIKLRDVKPDGEINGDDRQIIGQRDPKFMWGMTNTFSYKSFNLSIFVHGIHGITKANGLMSDAVYTEIRRNTMKKDWWTPDNPTNAYYKNADNANKMGGESGTYFEDASFIRIKDVSLSYDFPKEMFGKMNISRLRLFVTGRNLHTFTKWKGLDPELDDQDGFPLQKEYVFGLNLEF